MIFIGDSTVRNIFWATAKKLDQKAAVYEARTAEKHADISFNGAHVNLDFIWDPFLNSSNLQQLLASHRNTWDSGMREMRGNTSAEISVIGGGLWHARHLKHAALATFEASIYNVISSMALHSSRHLNPTDSRSYQEAPASNNLVIIAPVQIPLYGSLNTSSKAEFTMTPTRINLLNDYLHNVSTSQGAPVAWSYALMTRHEEAAYEESGVHVIDTVARQKADILLNMRCNAAITRISRYPMDKTCCNHYPRPNWVQVVILVGSATALPLILLRTLNNRKRLMFLPSFKICRAISVISMALCYSFFADRTHLFNKSQKQYSPTEFKTLCLVALALGILSLRRSAVTMQKTVDTAHKRALDQLFLSRDQTDEWKGWMQFAVLIYHYTGASKTLEIYKVIRILVASYLFMTGFGHTIFFYQKGDFSVRRYASVIVRLNMLSCLLPYTMGTDYLFYYFAPLISFWYMVIYFTMRTGRSRNSSIHFLVGKIIISATLVTALIRTPRLFEQIFSMLEHIFHIRWDAAEWRFRLQLDSYIVYVGMICGILLVRISSTLNGERNGHDFLPFIRQYWLQIRLSAIIASLITLPLFWHLTQRFSNKFDYNRWVPYISCFPILSFIVLRNCSRHARNFHSSIFAWLGRHSLETFTLQFHIWLAADTKGLLALGVFGRKRSYIDGRWPDFVLLTVIFFWVSWHVAAATGTVTAWIIDAGAGRSDGELGGMMAKPELPRIKSNWHLNAHAAEDAHMPILARLTGGLGRLVKEDLRVRLAIILGVLWVLNMVST